MGYPDVPITTEPHSQAGKREFAYRACDSPDGRFSDVKTFFGMTRGCVKKTGSALDRRGQGERKRVRRTQSGQVRSVPNPFAVRDVHSVSWGDGIPRCIS